MKTTDTTKNFQKKTTWSLQDNKRTETQRDAFRPTGKTPKNNTIIYVLSMIGVLLLLSFSLVKMYEEPLTTCLWADFCINTIDNPFAYTFFVFSNMAILILAFIVAYVIGKKLKSKLGF